MQFEITLNQVITAIIVFIVLVLLHRCKCTYYDIQVCETCGTGHQGMCEGYEAPKTDNLVHKMMVEKYEAAKREGYEAPVENLVHKMMVEKYEHPMIKELYEHPAMRELYELPGKKEHIAYVDDPKQNM